MLKDLFDKGKCALGYHVEAWQYAAPSVCRQTSHCARCGVISERTAHTWNGWHRFDDISCVVTRACQRCGRQETQDDHAYDAWAYDQREACLQHVRCSRCHQPGTATRVHHDRPGWEHSAFYDTHVAVCRRCGEMVFADADGDEEPVTFQQADAAVLHVMGASTADELRQRITQRQSVLFSAPGSYAMRFVADQRAAGESDRELVANLAALVARCRDEGIDAVFPPAAPAPVTSPSPSPSPSPPPSPPPAQVTPPSAPSGPRVEGRLVGRWRSTEMMSSGGFSMATDTHLRLDPDGRFTFWSMTSGSAGTAESDREVGTWTSDAGSLAIAFANGTTMSRRIQVERDTMIWPDDGRYRLWERIR